MQNIAKRINLIKKNHTGYKAELISKIARIVAFNTGMDLRAATAFAASQVGTTTKSLMVK